MLRAQGRIAAFHICDWLVPTTDLVFDRGMPGEGVINIPRIRAMAEAGRLSSARRYHSAATGTAMASSPSRVGRTSRGRAKRS
jgi:hypothetical protein